MEKVSIERVKEYSDEVANGVGAILPDLTSKASGKPVKREIIEAITKSSERELIVARLLDKIVGTAVMNHIVFTSGSKAWLEDFVVSADTSVRGQGVGYELWKEVVLWAQERNAPLEFTSADTRVAAHHFYHRQGASIKDTCVFTLPINKVL